MQLHANAALSLNKRRLLCRRVVELGGRGGLLDRSSAARTVANRTPEDRIEAIACLRRLRFTGGEIAEPLRMPEKDRVGEPHPDRDGPARPSGDSTPERRYERSRPGELLHVDVKKLGRCGSSPATASSRGRKPAAFRPHSLDRRVAAPTANTLFAATLASDREASVCLPCRRSWVRIPSAAWRNA